MAKSVKDTLEQRVTCRRYERIPLTDDQREQLRAAIRNTPTSFNAQNFSVIEIDDQQAKEHLYEIIGQKQIKTCALFQVFCIDFHKISVGARAKGVEMPPVYDRLDGVVDGVINASLALMSAVVSAESMGLGTCPIGYARTANPDKVAEALRLPRHVAVVCGLAIGVPREHNDPKPKQPDSLIFHRNTYADDSPIELAQQILDYDAVVTRYNETRAGATSDNDWVRHMVDYYREMLHLPMLEAMERRGFHLQTEMRISDTSR